ncbi:Uncharacterized protein QTN25_005022 [Entamoeba marina]
MAKLETFYLASVLLYVSDLKTFQTIRMVSKNCFEAGRTLRINPYGLKLPLNTICKSFSKIKTLRAPLSDIQKYCSQQQLKRITWFQCDENLIDFNKIQPRYYKQIYSIYLDSEYLPKVSSLPNLKKLRVDLTTKLNTIKSLSLPIVNQIIFSYPYSSYCSDIQLKNIISFAQNNKHIRMVYIGCAPQIKSIPSNLIFKAMLPYLYQPHWMLQNDVYVLDEFTQMHWDELLYHQQKHTVKIRTKKWSVKNVCFEKLCFDFDSFFLECDESCMMSLSFGKAYFNTFSIINHSKSKVTVLNFPDVNSFTLHANFNQISLPQYLHCDFDLFSSSYRVDIKKSVQLVGHFVLNNITLTPAVKVKKIQIPNLKFLSIMANSPSEAYEYSNSIQDYLQTNAILCLYDLHKPEINLLDVKKQQPKQKKLNGLNEEEDYDKYDDVQIDFDYKYQKIEKQPNSYY